MAKSLVLTSYVSFWYPFAAFKRQAEMGLLTIGLFLRVSHPLLFFPSPWYHYRFMRRSLWKSRTLVSGSVMIRDLERTTCTRNSVTLAVRMLSRACTRTWLPGIALASARSTYVFISLPEVYTSFLTFFFYIQILRVVEIEKTEDIRRPYIKQLLTPNVRFPLPHRVAKFRSTFVANRPATF